MQIQLEKLPPLFENFWLRHWPSTSLILLTWQNEAHLCSSGKKFFDKIDDLIQQSMKYV